MKKTINIIIMRVKTNGQHCVLMTKQCLALACLIVCDNDDFDHRYDHDGDPDDNYSDHDNDDGDHDALYKGQFRCGYDEETRTKKIGQRAIEMRGGMLRKLFQELSPRRLHIAKTN